MSTLTGISSLIGVGNMRFTAPAPPAVDEVNLISTRSSGTFGGGASTCGLRSTTGYVKVEWWDSTTTTYGSGSPTTTLNISKAIVSPYNNTNPKSIKVYSTDSAGNKSGSITRLANAGNFLTSVDVSGCSSMTFLSVTSVSVLANLVLPISKTSLQYLNLTTNANITQLNLDDYPLTDSITIVSYAALTSLSIKNTSAVYIFAQANTALSSVDLSGSSGLYFIDFGGCNSLTSVTATGVGTNLGNYPYSYSGSFISNSGISLYSTGMGGSALNQLYTDLLTPTTTPALIYIANASGAASDDPSIATAKGYVVIG